MRVGQPGQGEAGQVRCARRAVAGANVRGDRGEVPASGLDEHAGAHAPAWQPGKFRVPAAYAAGDHRHARSSRTAARAATPARQSALSACSAGEWDTPDGLRTNSIAAGTRAASTPAS